MDNTNILTEQNPSGKRELTDIERAKALFEYEMTEVLLNFKNEVKSVKGSSASEYISMEKPKSGVDYSAPDIELEGIGYREADSVVLDGDALRTETAVSFEGGVPEIPSVTQSGQAEVTLDASAFAHAAVEISEVKLSDCVPDISAQLSGIKAPVLPSDSAGVRFAAPQAEVHISVEPPAAVSASVDFAAPQPAELSAPGFKDIQQPAVRFETEQLPDLTAQVEVAEAERIVISAIPEAEVLSVSIDTPEVNAVSLPDLLRTEVRYRSVEVPEARRIALTEELTAPEVSVAVDVPDISKPELSAAERPETETAVIEYPDVPEKPDFSAYYAEIEEALRQEL